MYRIVLHSLLKMIPEGCTQWSHLVHVKKMLLLVSLNLGQCGQLEQRPFSGQEGKMSSLQLLHSLDDGVMMYYLSASSVHVVWRNEAALCANADSFLKLQKVLAVIICIL